MTGQESEEFNQEYFKELQGNTQEVVEWLNEWEDMRDSLDEVVGVLYDDLESLSTAHWEEIENAMSDMEDARKRLADSVQTLSEHLDDQVIDE